MVRSFQHHANAGAGANKGQNPQGIQLREHPFETVWVHWFEGDA